MMKKTSQRLPASRTKICNICGEDCLVYTIDRNAPICDECRPRKKKVPSEGEMMQRILGGKEDELE